MATLHRPVELESLCQRLAGSYGPLFEGVGQAGPQRLFNFRSRALLGFALECLAGTTAAEGAAAIVDGGGDNGIDAIHVGLDRRVWLLQSKYIDAAVGEPELGDVNKVCTGVRDLLAGRWERFNAAVQAKRAAITSALADPACQVRLVLVHTGGAMSDDRRRLLGDLERAFNSGHAQGDYLRCTVLGLEALHDLHLELLAREPIREEAELRDYGFLREPYRAVYGRLSARQLADWQRRHGVALVERNLRRYKGSTDVNDGLAQTLREQAAHFFYFNNGVTLLCDAFTQVGPRQESRDSGRFELRGMSIINGAQTVGAMAREPDAHYAHNPSEVLVTIVSLERAPQGFGEQVTLNRNRQNAVDIRDFAALDERQQRWHDTLDLVGVNYVCQPGEGDDGDPPAGEQVFDVAEAARALACCNTGREWAQDLVAATADRRRLFRRAAPADAPPGTPSPYQRTFPDSLPAKELWRAVQVARAVDRAVKARARAEADPANLPAGVLPAREVLMEGRWLLLHLLFLKTDLQRGQALALEAAEHERISRAVDRIALLLVQAAQAQPWGRQAAAVFRNAGDCATLKAAVMHTLAHETL